MLIILCWGFFIVLIFVCVINILIHLATKTYIYKSAGNIPEAQAVLIPGAAILQNGGLERFHVMPSDRVLIPVEHAF